MADIDYKKLNDKIVEQAYAGLYTLGEKEKRELIEGKIERARLYREALEKIRSV